VQAELALRLRRFSFPRQGPARLETNEQKFAPENDRVNTATGEGWISRELPKTKNCCLCYKALSVQAFGMKRGQRDSRCKTCRNRKRRDRYHRRPAPEGIVNTASSPQIEVLLKLVPASIGTSDIAQSIFLQLAMDMMMEAS
jgi:hypothetical protein